MDNYCLLWINMVSYPHKRVKNQLYRVECKTISEFYQHFAIKKMLIMNTTPYLCLTTNNMYKLH